jgi:hypothetical protein
MPLGGETIGRAYIKILADGQGLDKSIEKEFDKATPAVKAVGGRQSEAYIQEFRKRLSQEDIGKSVRNSLERGIAKSDVAQAYFGSRDWQRFKGVLKKRFGEQGLLAGHELEREFAHGISGLDNAVEDILPRIEKAGRRIADAAAIGPFDVHIGMHETVDLDTEQAGRDAHHLADEVEHLGGEVDTTTGKVDRHASAWRRARNRMKDWEHDTPRLTHRLRDMGSGLDKFGEGIGKSFGKGSRNDFVNIVGSIVGAVAKLPSTLANIAGSAVDFGKTMLAPFQRIIAAVGEAEGVGQKVAAGMTQFAAEASTAAPLIAAAAIATLLLGGAVMGLVAAFASLGGALVGMAATVGFGAVGVLGPLAALLFPVAAAIGTVGLAISGIMGKGGKLKAEFKGIGTEFKNWGKIAAEGLFGGDNLSGLIELMKEFEPIIQVVAETLGGMLSDLVKSSKGPGFQNFLKNMQTFLPNAIKQLGTIAGNVFTGIGGIFTALTSNVGGTKSVTQSFLDWLTKLTGDFAAWSTSIKGQHELRDFFDKAWASAQTLGKFIGTLTSLIGTLLDKSKPTGDSLFDDLTKKAQEFVTWLQDPKNQTVIKNWFLDAKSTAEDLGTVISTISDLIAAIDTPENRFIGRVIFGVIAEMATAAKWAIKALVDYMGLFAAGVDDILQFVRPLFVAMRDMPNPFGTPLIKGIKATGGALVGGIDNVHGLRNSFDNLSTRMDHATGKAKETASAVGGIPTAVTTHVHLDSAAAEASIKRYGGMLDGLDGRTVETFVMAWDGYFTYAGQEFINASRTEVYAKEAGWFKPVLDADDLGPILGEEYRNPLQDPAPWGDPDSRCRTSSTVRTRWT